MKSNKIYFSIKFAAVFLIIFIYCATNLFAENKTASDGQNGDYFGNSTAVTEDVVIIGAPHEATGNKYAGAAYTFERNVGGANSWCEVKKLTATFN